ncbi:MAG: dihydropteroate synthase [Flavobacteriales bacterium]|jgi:dihydropteroate synthase|tara:strand:- start:3530 stop:4360 length:831 start_codon:yes stop_codon:yes gene_type:complete
MTINIKGTLLDLTKPKIMGILNITPDSFFDGGEYNSEYKILNQVEKMLLEGADIIDIGGHSSRPGAKKLTIEKETERVIPIIKLIVGKFKNIIISIDTFRSEIARKAIEAGASIINDISGGDLDKKMYQVAGELKVPYIIMHMKGVPSNMQNDTEYDNVIFDIIKNLSYKIDLAKKAGVLDIIIDPGFGFGKSLKDNFKILKNLSSFKQLNQPIMVGLSRKSMIYKLLESSANDALNGTTCLNSISLNNGANIIRVHDVKEAKEAVKLIEFMNENS